jgi:hypothetical protein
MRPLSEGRAGKGLNSSNSTIFSSSPSQIVSLTSLVIFSSSILVLILTRLPPPYFLNINGSIELKNLVLSFLWLCIYTIRRKYILWSSEKI